MRVTRSRERAVDEPRRIGNLNKEVARVKEYEERAKVGDLVSAVTGAETEPENRLSFDEAKKSLEGIVDLETLRKETVRNHRRWGLLDTLMEKGAIGNESDYMDLLGQSTIGEKGLNQLIELVKEKARVLTVFDPGVLMPDELFKSIFTIKQVGEPDLALYYSDTYAFKNLNNIRRIGPESLPDLTKLMKMQSEAQVEAFKEAYKKSDEPLRPNGPRLFFTHECQNVTYNKKSVAENIRSSARGEMQFLDPVAGFLAARVRMDASMGAILKVLGRGKEYSTMPDNFYRSSLIKLLKDRTILDKMPDNKRIVRYPNYVFEDGYVPSMTFHPNNRIFLLGESAPHVSEEKVGSRIMYG